MCDYSLHAMATRPAEVGETVVTTTFRGTSTRGSADGYGPEPSIAEWENSARSIRTSRIDTMMRSSFRTAIMCW